MKTLVIHKSFNFTTQQLNLWEKIISWLEEGAPHTRKGVGFNMNNVINSDEYTNDYNIEKCGTSCCIAGAAMLWGDDSRFYEGMSNQKLVEAMWPYSFIKLGSQQLGIDIEDGIALFHSHEDNEKYDSPKNVAILLRDYLMIGEIPNDFL